MKALPEPARRGAPGRVMRFVWLALGWLCVALGLVGAVLPLMPTTVFLILAAGCFARSSPRLKAWLLTHPRFGPTLRAWRDDGAIGFRAKSMACAGMAGGYAIFLVTAHPGARLAVMAALLMVACALYVLTRPTALK